MSERRIAAILAVLLPGLYCAATAHAQVNNIIGGGSFENGSLPFTFPVRWELNHSLFGDDAVCTSECFSAYTAADGDYYVLIAGGTFEQNTAGLLRLAPLPVPVDATTFEFEWSILGNGGPGSPCAGPQDGLTLLVDGMPVWSNLADGDCVNVIPYANVAIDLAALGLNDGRYHVFEFRGAATGVPPATLISNVYLDNLRLFVTEGPDSDGDGVQDSLDNCVEAANATQCDTDFDGIGNRCDADFNNDCVVNVIDLGIMRSLYFMPHTVADLNCDGVTNSATVIDLGLLRTMFLQPVGRSGLANDCQPKK